MKFDLKKNKYLYLEILCVIVLLIFIIVLCISRSGGTKKSIEEISSPVIKVLQDNQMSKKTNADAIKAFGFDLSKTDGIVYYENENIMEVSEMVIIKLKDSNDAQEFKTLIEKRVEERKNLYKSYAPEQYALLNDCIIESSSNAIFYCTAKNADKLFEIFKNSL
ncbi:MAG: DUF4358 domain-containing protein [Eubacterium sp.]|nr:DUF4358 domain-containing protein [Eubacterium sp.]